jgi:type IV pilus assembly protein PilM
MAKRFLTLNIGASTVALAEYELGGRGALSLVNYGTAQLSASLDSGDPQTILVPAILQIVREKGIKPGKVAISVSGQMVFPKFAAIPMAGGSDRFEQLVRYEVEQNIPFPIDEMVCDRQVIGDTPNGDKSVMIVAAKLDQIEAITSAVSAAGFSPDIVDASPIAVINAVRYNRPEEEGACIITIDIGARTTSLVIAEGDKLYNRSIPVAGNALTKEIAQALGCSIEDAERIKLEQAYVSLGGVTEDEDEVADRVSKVCRAVLTRLHAEITRSINFYRSQQGGSAPVKMYLTGGSALLPQIDRFFSDSLQIEVEFFYPFEKVAAGSKLNADQLAMDSAFLAATAGVAAHMAGKARFAINLLPPSIIEARAEKARIPVLATGVAMFVGALVVMYMAMGISEKAEATRLESVRSQLDTLNRYKNGVLKAAKDFEAAHEDAESLRKLLAERSRSTTKMKTIYDVIARNKFGIWIEAWKTEEKEGRTVDVITFRCWEDKIDKADLKGKPVAQYILEKIENQEAVKSVKSAQFDGANKSIEDNNGREKGCVQQFSMEVEFK